MRVNARFTSVLVVLALVVSACGLGTGASRESLIDILMVEGDLTSEQALCISDALYATPGLTEDQINNFSVVSEVDADSNDAGAFALYQNAVDTAVKTCVR